jgi:hypothetical protein
MRKTPGTAGVMLPRLEAGMLEDWYRTIEHS